MAQQLIQADEQVITQLHRAGIRVVGGTLLPFGGSTISTPAREAVREQLNSWIRSSGAFDAVADFDAALRDPADPSRLRGVYDSGDHAHPNDAGYRAMADAVPVGALR